MSQYSLESTLNPSQHFNEKNLDELPFKAVIEAILETLEAYVEDRRSEETLYYDWGKSQKRIILVGDKKQIEPKETVDIKELSLFTTLNTAQSYADLSKGLDIIICNRHDLLGRGQLAGFVKSLKVASDAATAADRTPTEMPNGFFFEPKTSVKMRSIQASKMFFQSIMAAPENCYSAALGLRLGVRINNFVKDTFRMRPT